MQVEEDEGEDKSKDIDMVQNGDIGVEDFKGCRWSVKVGNSVVMVVSMRS